MVRQKAEAFREYIGSVQMPGDIGREKWIVSPMKRCIETAGLLMENCRDLRQPTGAADSAAKEQAGTDDIAVEIQSELRECDFGLFENRNYIEMNGDPDYQAWIDSGGTMPFPQGESPEGFKARCCNAFLKRVQEAEDGDHLIFVVHGGTIMSIMERFAVDMDGMRKSYYDWHVKNAGGYGLTLYRKPESGENEIVLTVVSEI